jgi:hypothetical protein
MVVLPTPPFGEQTQTNGMWQSFPAVNLWLVFLSRRAGFVVAGQTDE